MSAISPPFTVPVKPLRPEPERDEHGAIIYPETDGLPMAWSTEHYDWLTFLKDGLETHFAPREDVFVAGDLLWYPVEGHPEISAAPDVFVVFGRPKGARRSYLQWKEGGLAPQVSFEVMSHKNTVSEMARKQAFYQRHGIQEYYIYDPETVELVVLVRQDGQFLLVDDPQGFSSPLLGVTFWTQKENGLCVVLPDGSRMLSHAEQVKRAEVEKQRAEEGKQRAETERQRAEKLAARLRELGVDPDAE